MKLYGVDIRFTNNNNNKIPFNTEKNIAKDQIIYDKRKAMGESIRAMRTAQGWEQEQLAQIAGITAANVRSIEAGKYAVNIDVLNKVAIALGAELRMIEKE